MNFKITKSLILISVILFTFSCKKSSKNESVPVKSYLAAINNFKELYLVYSDDRFGEFGGNSFEIKIYKKRNDTILLADYREYEATTEPPPPLKSYDYESIMKSSYQRFPVIDSTIEIKLTENQKKIAEQAVIELAENFLNVYEETPNFYGESYRVFSSYFSLDIHDGAPNKWVNYKLLKKSLLKR